MHFYPKQYYVASYISTLVKTAERLSCDESYISAIRSVDISDRQYYVDAKLPDEAVISCYKKYPNLSFEFGRDMTAGEHEYLGYLTKSSETVVQALDMWPKYIKSRTSLIEFSVNDDKEHIFINLKFNGIAEKRIEFFFEALVSSLGTITRAVTNIEKFCADLEVTYPQPDHFNLYREYFRHATVHFNSPSNRIILRKDIINQEFSTKDPVLLGLCEDQCRAAIAKLPALNTLKDNILQYLENQDSGIPTLPVIAKHFAVSERTLKRKLEEEGESYRQILEAYKNQKARELLVDTVTDIATISDYLGYADVSGFHRAFKRWHQGISPAQYRKEFTGKLLPGHKV